MPPVIDTDKCQLRGTCYDVCPQDVFTFDNEEPAVVAYPEECWYCGACVFDCPQEAIHLKLPLQMHIVPSPALYASPDKYDATELKKGAAFSRPVIESNERENS